MHDDLDALLRLWGECYGSGGRAFAGARSGGHPIAQAMQFGSRKNRELPRRGERLSLRQACDCGGVATCPQCGGSGWARPAPKWARVAVRCAETRSRRTATPHDIPAAARRVDAAVVALDAWDRDAGAVIRAEYCWAGETTQADRAAELEITVRQYRARLFASRVWIAGRLGVRLHAAISTR